MEGVVEKAHLNKGFRVVRRLEILRPIARFEPIE